MGPDRRVPARTHSNAQTNARGRERVCVSSLGTLHRAEWSLLVVGGWLFAVSSLLELESSLLLSSLSSLSLSGGRKARRRVAAAVAQVGTVLARPREWSWRTLLSKSLSAVDRHTRRRTITRNLCRGGHCHFWNTGASSSS